MHLDKALRDIEKIKTTKNERSDKRLLEDELRKVKDEQMDRQAKKKVERRLLEHGVLPLVGSKKQLGGVTRGVSVDQRVLG